MGTWWRLFINEVQKTIMANYWLQQAIADIKKDLQMDEKTMRHVVSMILCELYVKRDTLDNLHLWNS